MHQKSGHSLDVGLAVGTLLGMLASTTFDNAGLGIALGAAGGFLIGFLASIVLGKCVERKRKRKP